MERLIEAISQGRPDKVIHELRNKEINSSSGKFDLNADWLVERVAQLKERLPGPELSPNDRLRKRVLGAVLGEAMMEHLDIAPSQREIVRRVIAKRVAKDEIFESGMAEATLVRIYEKFDDLKKQLNEKKAGGGLDADSFYSIWDHVANGAIYFTP
ncbi:MAG: hypothetical protein QXR53_04760 [Candidatus Norongarragalinales archaeon]